MATVTQETERPQRKRRETIIDIFFGHTKESPERPAMRHNVDGVWRAISWGAYGTAVREASAGLVTLGIEPGDRVGLVAANQPRWHMADLGIVAVGAISVPVYPTGAASQVAHVLGHSGCRVCFVGDRDQLAKVLLVQRRLPELERIVVLEPPPAGLDDDLLLTFEDLQALGRDRLEQDPGTVDRRAREITVDSLATIVYTSGTTGPPKGVMLTHANVVDTITCITDVIPVGPTDRYLSFLPLSHIAERIVSHIGLILSGGETWFARSLATLAEDLRACRPTIFFAVPRVWEKFQDAVLYELGHSPRPVRALAERYIRLGLERVEARTTGQRTPLANHAAYLALDRTVGRKIRQGLGLDHGRVFVSAAAPIRPDLLRWFHAVNLPVAEVYGQTEGSGPTTLNRPGRIRVGTVGEPLPRVEVRIAPDGEILVRGPNVCSGYYRQPEATRALLGEDGWMRTGDSGHLDRLGYLHITGRKKDLIITSSGKNIAPQEMETALAAEPLISQAIVVGDGRPYLTALLALDVDAAIAYVENRDGHRGGDLVDLEVLASHPAIREELDHSVRRFNAGRAPIEQVKAWRILPRELTIVGGELTPTLKVRREIVAGRFHELIDEMYTSGSGAPTATGTGGRR
jgi:long-chain acyl-CoA synthetase